MTEKPSDPASTRANAGELTAFVRASAYALLESPASSAPAERSDGPFQDGGDPVRRESGLRSRTRRKNQTVIPPPVFARAPAGNAPLAPEPRRQMEELEPASAYLSDLSNSQYDSRNGEKGFFFKSYLFRHVFPLNGFDVKFLAVAAKTVVFLLDTMFLFRNCAE